MTGTKTTPALTPSTRISLAALLVALAAATGCAGTQRRAAGRRPTVVLAAVPGECAPAALVDIDNPGRCAVQLVARDAEREVVGASPWIGAGARDASYQLPARFAWVVLEVDPLCASPVGRIRYRPAPGACEGRALASR